MTSRKQKGRLLIKNVIVKSIQEEPLVVKILSLQEGFGTSLVVEKGFVHVASRVFPGDDCIVAENGPFSVKIHVDKGSPSQNLAVLTAYHHTRPLAKIDVRNTAVERHELVAGITVSGLENVAEHLVKKIAVMPRTSLIGSFDIDLGSASGCDFKHFATNALSCTAPIVERDVKGAGFVSCPLPHTMKTAFHFNNKLISIIHSAYTDYDLPRSRGIFLNAALAYNSTYQNKTTDYRGILADTLETIPLTAQLPQSGIVRTRLSVKGANGVMKVPVYEADQDTVQLLSAVWGSSCSPVARPVFYLFSREGVPILFGCPLDRTLQGVRKTMTDSTGRSWTGPVEKAASVGDALHILNYAHEVWLRDPEAQKLSGSWKAFASQWKKISTQAFPESAHILREAAHSTTCRSVPALLCLIQESNT